jgi:O-succinylbenzoic acid--CoA ligase
MLVPDWLAQRAIQRGDRLALAFNGQKWTYAQLANQVTRLAELLINRGIAQQQYVAILMGNRAEYVFLIHALAKIGAIVVLINTRLSAAEIGWQLGHSNSRWLIYDSTHQELATTALKFAGSEHNHHSQAIAIELIELGTPVPNDQLANFENKRTKDINDRALTDSCVQEIDLNIDLNRVQAIVYTSGTTGKPKGVQLTFGNHFFSATASAFNLGVEPDRDRWLVCLPLFHVGGLAIIWRSVIYGSALILQSRFEVEMVIKAIVNEQVTLISLVPTMLKRIMADEKFPNSLPHWQQVRAILLGGAAVNEQLWYRCLELNLAIAPTYGLTEAASQVTTLTPAEAKYKFGSSGRSLLCNQIRIVAIDSIRNSETLSDPTQALPAGEIGQILVHGANVMPGYLIGGDREAQNSQVLVSNEGINSSANWFPTGDLGYLDAAGFLYVVNRRHDLIVSGGENIYPAEIEAILAQHSQMKEFCVIGTDCPDWGQKVTVVIAVSSQNFINTTLEQIREFCQQHNLARYKLPKAIAIVADLPRTASGKIDRQKLRELVESKS